MKKIYQLFIASVMSFVIAGCGQTQTNSDYRKAVKDGDFETAHEAVNELHDAYLQETKRWDNDNFSKAKNAYFEALSYVYENEIRLIVSQDMNCGEKIAYMISEIPLDGDVPNQGLCDYHTASDALSGSMFNDCGLPWSRYIYSVQAVNKICDKTVNLAVLQKNEELARAVAEQYKEDVEVITGSRDCEVDSISVDGSHGYVKYSSKSKDAAIEKINAAFGSAE